MDYTPELPPHFRKNKKHKDDSNKDEDEYGPALPSHLKSKTNFLPQIRVQINNFSSKSNSDDDSYGPSLPSHLKKSKKHLGTDINKSYGPAMPPTRTVTLATEASDEDTYGPVLPPSLQQNHNSIDLTNSGSESEDSYGPALPPHLLPKKNKSLSDSSKKQCNSKKIIGPSIPSRLISNDSSHADEDDDDDSVYCPDLPPHLSGNSSKTINVKVGISSESDSDDSDDGEAYGPMPSANPVDMDQYIEKTIHQRTEAQEEKLRDVSFLNYC